MSNSSDERFLVPLAHGFRATSDGCRLVAVGCENGLWIGRSNDHTPLRPVLPNLKKITQCAVLVSSGILLVLAEKVRLSCAAESRL